jgi:hypothetical protein
MKKTILIKRLPIFILSFLMMFSVFAQNSTGKRWSLEKINQWASKQPWIIGANFLPSDATNQLEMWQKETWNPKLIDKELGWAEKIGMNTVRVYLHYFPYRDDKEGFYQRIDEYLSIANKHHIKTIFVFFDDCWYPEPKPGKQPEPKPHVHNAGWVQNPGKEILWDPSKHGQLKPFVQDILKRYSEDDRILFWDLYNEPQNTNLLSYHDTGKEKYSLMLLKEVFEWGREINPSQPLTSGLWTGDWWTNPDSLSAFNRFMIDHSDVLTFHNYETLDGFKNMAEPLLRLNRPVVCTEYMSRGSGSTFEAILPYAAEHNIGMINWGLVAGRSQTIYPWDSWEKEYTSEPVPWFHDIFYPDGKPYNKEEIKLIKKIVKEKN